MKYKIPVIKNDGILHISVTDEYLDSLGISCKEFIKDYKRLMILANEREGIWEEIALRLLSKRVLN